MSPRPFVLAALSLVVLSWAAPALAQPAQPRRPMEIGGGLVWIAPRSLGSIDASLLDADGDPVTLFSADVETAAGLGLEVILSQEVASRLDVEVLGGWTRFDVRTVVTDDLEDVPEIALTETLTRYSIEGGVLWRFAGTGRTAWFVRGSGGWMRETASDMSLAENGWVATGAVGFKYWMSRRPTGQDRVGIRAEMRLLYRRDGIALDDGDFRIWPAGAASAVVRF